MRRAWLAVAVLAAALAFGSTRPAQACSCVPPSAGMANEGDAAFVGVFVSRIAVGVAPAPNEPVSSGRPVLNHFDVERVIHGGIGKTVDVEAPESGASCGLELSPGDRVGLVLYRRGEVWTSSLCSQFETAAYPPATGGGGSVLPAVVLGLLAVAAAVVGDRRKL